MIIARLLVLLLLAPVAQAQVDTLRDEALPAASTPIEPSAETPTAVPEPPTRRPTRPPAPTVTDSATATATESATAVPPAATRPPAATATRPPAATASPTPSPTLALLARLTGGGDPGVVPVALGGLLALLSAWLGARIARGGERRARAHARTTLATAMLLELRRLDAVLRRVVGLDNPASFPSLDHPIMEAALRDLPLFDTETAARIAQFHGALRGIQHEIGDYRDNPLRWAGRLGELNQIIKVRATSACRAVPALATGLAKAGGAPPPHLSEAGPGTDRAQLPPPPFGAGEGDDWTL